MNLIKSHSQVPNYSYNKAQNNINLSQLEKYRKNVQIFKKHVQEEINQLINQHIKEIKDLTNVINKQKKIIQSYQGKYGKLARYEIQKEQQKKNSASRNSTSPNSPTLRKHSNMYDNKNELIITNLKSTIYRQKDLDQQLLTPPDQMFCSKLYAKKSQKKKEENGLYKDMKQQNKNIQQNTNKLLKLIGKTVDKPKSNYLQQLDRNQELQQKTIKQVESPRKKKGTEKIDIKAEQPLNSSLIYLCQSLDRSSSKKKNNFQNKKKIIDRSKLQKINPQQQQMLKKRRLNAILREMRQQIQVKKQEKVQQIKQSKLLPTGNGINKNNKVMIIPVAIDLKRKMQSGDLGSPQIIRSEISGILKKGSTIQGLSSISNHTRRSLGQKSLIELS